MGWIQSAAAIMLICLAASGASGQTTPPTDPEAETAPLVPPGPIVNGKHIQPSQTDIEEREAVRQPGQPGQPEATPRRGGDTRDKELDELYDEVLKQSKQR
jgi:hypothetical protein